MQASNSKASEQSKQPNQPINQSTLSNYALWTSLKYKWSKLSVNANLRAGYNTKYKHPLIPALHLKLKISDFLVGVF